MIYLLDRNQIISHSVNKSEIHPALSEIAKFISISILKHPCSNVRDPHRELADVCRVTQNSLLTANSCVRRVDLRSMIATISEWLRYCG